MTGWQGDLGDGPEDTAVDVDGSGPLRSIAWTFNVRPRPPQPTGNSKADEPSRTFGRAWQDVDRRMCRCVVGGEGGGQKRNCTYTALVGGASRNSRVAREDAGAWAGGGAMQGSRGQETAPPILKTRLSVATMVATNSIVGSLTPLPPTRGAHRPPST